MSFQRDSRGGKKYGKRGFGGGHSGGPGLHKAICSECQKECHVPFKPTGEKPVYCRLCFKNKESGAPREFVRRNETERSPNKTAGADMTSEQFKILNSKLDQILEALAQ